MGKKQNVESTPIEFQQLIPKKGEKKILPKIEFDETQYTLVGIDDAIDNPAQRTLYGQTKRENGPTTEDARLMHISDLVDSIIEQGLKQLPIILKFPDNRLMFEAGMTRREALRRMGATHVPATIKTMDISLEEYISNTDPDMWAQRYKDVMGSNLMDTERMHVSNKFLQILALKKEYKENFDEEMPEKLFKQLLKQNGLKIKHWNMGAKLLKYSEDDLYKRWINLGFSLTGAYNELNDRLNATTKNKVMTSSSAGNNLLNEDTIVEILNAAAATMNEIRQTKMRVRGHDYPFFGTIQKNTESALLHEAIVKSFKYIMEDNSKDADGNITTFWEALISLRDDLYCAKNSMVVDVKTRIEGSKEWATNVKNIKTGYYLLVECDSDFERWFVGYGFISADDWKSNKGTATYHNNKLLENKSNMKILVGDIKKDSKGNCKIHLDSII